jgi:alpha-glucosidase (family GH31 glycosyl hydrolase)
LLKKSGNYTIWSKSQLSGVLDEGQQDHQANSFHPMYLSKEALPKSWHILAMRTSSGIGFEYNYNENITFNMMGGIFYLKIFIGDSPGKVIESYHKYLGGYLIPPFWATGFHQSRRGYNKSDALIQVWDNFNKHRLPIDAVWSDVDYMSNFETFTIDLSRFNTTAMMDTMLDASQKAVKWLPTIPSSIHTEQALAKNYTGLVVKSGNYEGKPLVGCGLSGTVYFPDYNNPNTILQLEYSLKTLM